MAFTHTRPGPRAAIIFSPRLKVSDFLQSTPLPNSSIACEASDASLGPHTQAH